MVANSKIITVHTAAITANGNSGWIDLLALLKAAGISLAPEHRGQLIEPGDPGGWMFDKVLLFFNTDASGSQTLDIDVYQSWTALHQAAGGVKVHDLAQISTSPKSQQLVCPAGYSQTAYNTVPPTNRFYFAWTREGVPSGTVNLTIEALVRW